MKKSLVVVAHPDDETIFFSGIVQRQRFNEWSFLCVTDGDALGRGEERQREFGQACDALGARNLGVLGYPDRPRERVDIPSLVARLRKLENFDEIYTHNVFGEYGHPHHQDVSRAVHEAFQDQKPRSIAWNCFPEARVELTKAEFDKKREILWNIYRKEADLYALPRLIYASEGWLEMPFSVNAGIYSRIVEGKGKPPQPLTPDLEQYAELIEITRVGPTNTPRK